MRVPRQQKQIGLAAPDGQVECRSTNADCAPFLSLAPLRKRTEPDTSLRVTFLALPPPLATYRSTTRDALRRLCLEMHIGVSGAEVSRDARTIGLKPATKQ
jgi:hypothetical protein